KRGISAGNNRKKADTLPHGSPMSHPWVNGITWMTFHDAIEFRRCGSYHGHQFGRRHAMDLKFSHIDVLVENLEEACDYYAQILKARISKTLVWERGGLHVRYAIALIGQERFMLVQPLAGNLRELLDASSEGMIYRHCYST